MRLISPIGLKQNIALNVILETGKRLECIIDDEPSVDPVHAAGGCYCRECINNIPDGNGKPYCRWLELYIKDLNFFCRDGERKEPAHD